MTYMYHINYTNTVTQKVNATFCTGNNAVEAQAEFFEHHSKWTHEINRVTPLLDEEMSYCFKAGTVRVPPELRHPGCPERVVPGTKDYDRVCGF